MQYKYKYRFRFELIIISKLIQEKKKKSFDKTFCANQSRGLVGAAIKENKYGKIYYKILDFDCEKVLLK